MIETILDKMYSYVCDVIFFGIFNHTLRNIIFKVYAIIKIVFHSANREGMSILNNIADTLDIEDFIIMRLHTNDIMIDAFNFIKGYGI